MPKFTTPFNSLTKKQKEQFGKSFSKFKPIYKLQKHKEYGHYYLEPELDPETGEIKTENVYDFVQNEKDKCYLISTEGLRNSTGNLVVDEKTLSSLKRGQFGDFTNSPHTKEELIDRTKKAKKLKGLIFNSDGTFNKNNVNIVEDFYISEKKTKKLIKKKDKVEEKE